MANGNKIYQWYILFSFRTRENLLGSVKRNMGYVCDVRISFDQRETKSDDIIGKGDTKYKVKEG